jgi:Domain of unknown function (DUF5679)
LQRAFGGLTIVREAAVRGGLEAHRGRRQAVAQYEGYCMKDREKRKFEGTIVTLKNGRPAAQGVCPTCGTKLTRILSKAEAGQS